ncbi:MAG: hypothetical protein R3B70_40385 [Polyangiaceae bacterium]
MKSDRTRNDGEERAPRAALTWIAGALAVGLAGFVGLRWGAGALGCAVGVASLGAIFGFRAGVGAGLARGSRALDALRERLVAAEGQVVRARLTALRAPSGESEHLLAAEIERREKAEAEAAGERRAQEALRRQAQQSISEERARSFAAKEQADAAQRSIAEERARSLAAKEQADAAQREVQRLLSEVQRLSSEVHRRTSDQSGALREVERLLAPYAERERLLLDLARLDGAARGGLPDLLDAIAKKANFASIVLSDESGLPVAASRATRDPESVAATSALLFMLADRIAECGLPSPMAVLVHDEANETILHRLFRVQGGRFMLTAAGRGRGLVPETLDPTLHMLERVLLREALPA